MKELSIFTDESGDFGPYEPHSPFYIVTMVMHDQSVDITENINHLNAKIRDSGLPDGPIHAGPRTLELLALKAERKVLSNSELALFTSPKNLYKSYLRAIQRKRFE